MSGPSRRIRLTLPVSVAADRVLEVMRRQDNRLYLRGEVFWSPNVYANGDLLSVLRGYGFGVPADAANAHGQAVSTVQLVGMAEGFSNSVLLYSAADAKTQVFAASKSPSVVKMELSEDLSTNGTPETADAIAARGQLVSTLQAIAMPSKDLVFGYGQTLGEFKVQLLATDPADAEEAFGCVRGYLVGSLNPGSDVGLAIVLTGTGESVGELFGESQEPEPVLMVSDAEFETSCTAEALGSCTVTFMVNGRVVHEAVVLEGESCSDPVSTGIVSEPVKQPTVSHTYEFSGWTTVENSAAESDALTSITQNIVVYPAFTESIRYYDISFYDDGVLLATIPFAYGETPSYVAVKDDMVASGWVPELAPVSGEASYIAQWRDPLALADASWSEIAAIAESGRASEFYDIGSTKEFVANGVTYTAQIAAFDYDTLTEDITKTAGISFVITGHYPTTVRFGSYTESLKWYNYNAYKVCNNTIYPSIQEDLRAVIKQVQKATCYSSWYTHKGTHLSNNYLWLPSAAELGGSGYENKAAYPLFTDDASRILGDGKEYVTRSTSYRNVTAVGEAGAFYTGSGDGYYRLRFGFCI